MRFLLAECGILLGRKGRRNGKILRRGSEFVLGLLSTVFLGLIAFYIAVTGTPEDETFGDFLGLLGAGSAFLWFIGAVLTSKVVLRSDGMRVDNWFTSYRIPWQAVSHVEADPAVVVVLNDDTELELGIGDGSVLNMLRGNRYQHKVRDKIEQFRAAAASVDVPGDDSAMVRKWRPGIVRLVGWAVLFFGTAALMGHLF